MQDRKFRLVSYYYFYFMRSFIIFIYFIFYKINYNINNEIITLLKTFNRGDIFFISFSKKDALNNFINERKYIFFILKFREDFY